MRGMEKVERQKFFSCSHNTRTRHGLLVDLEACMPQVYLLMRGWLAAMWGLGNGKGHSSPNWLGLQPALDDGNVSLNPGSWASAGGSQHPYEEVSAPLGAHLYPATVQKIKIMLGR